MKRAILLDAELYGRENDKFLSQILYTLNLKPCSARVHMLYLTVDYFNDVRRCPCNVLEVEGFRFYSTRGRPHSGPHTCKHRRLTPNLIKTATKLLVNLNPEAVNLQGNTYIGPAWIVPT